MKFTYDTRHNIAYIRFHEKKEEVESIKISDELVIDMSPDGRIYGIEMLNANEQIKSEDEGKFLVVNEATGVTTEMPLPAE